MFEPGCFVSAFVIHDIHVCGTLREFRDTSNLTEFFKAPIIADKKIKTLELDYSLARNSSLVYIH